MAKYCQDCGVELKKKSILGTGLCKECTRIRSKRNFEILGALFLVALVLIPIFLVTYSYSFGDSKATKKITIPNTVQKPTTKITPPKVETCKNVEYIHKITSGSKPVMSIVCNRQFSETLCVDKTAILGRCKKQDTISTCVEQKTSCYIKVKNYEREVGKFGYKASFTNPEGTITKNPIYKDVYPNKEETFRWEFTHPPGQTIKCSVKEVTIPKKRVCN